MEPKFTIGSTVRKKNQKENIGTILETPSLQQGLYWYRIRLFDNRIVNVPEESLEPYIANANPEEHFLNNSFSTRESFSRIITFNKLIGGYQNNPSSLKASRALFKPHQYKPLLKFLYSNSQRLLIADEVGLGKTIEAGFILLELMARRPLKTALVICPKSLCIKWERELNDKFYLSFDILSKDRFLKFLNDYERGTLTKQFHGIISYQSMRSRQIREALREVNPEIDFVIFDEMHWSRNESSQTFKLARIISEYSDSVVGLTATPIMLGNKNLYNLLNILDPFEFQSEIDFNQRIGENKHITETLRALSASDYLRALNSIVNLENGIFSNQFKDSPIYESIKNRLRNQEPNREETIKLLKDTTELSLLSHIVTRTRRREVELKSTRKSHTCKIDFTTIEKGFYDAVTNFLQNKYRLTSTERRGASFALMMPQRQVASCIPAMIQSYKNNSDFINNLYELFEEVEDFSIDDYEEDNQKDIENIIEGIKELISSLENNIHEFPDSKYNELKKVLEYHKNNTDSKILLFSFFKPTLYYLEKRLINDGFDCYLICGDIDYTERQEIMDNFRNLNDKRILLSSEVGSEGIDLEFCSVVVNYDLPWNPMVVEQRIGRIDRFGQKSDVVTIVNFAVSGTIEEKILNRLYERIGIFKESIGDLEEILGDEIQKLEYDLLKQNLTPEEQELRIEETAKVIINRKIEAQLLEEQSAGLLTNDEFFRQELEAILTEKRYVTSEELIIYINEFFKTKYPSCRIQPTLDKSIYKLYISPELESAIRLMLRENKVLDDNTAFEFFSKISLYENREVLITFDPEYAHEHKKIIHINSFHPIVKYITEYLRLNPTEIFPCSIIELNSSKYLVSGVYFYFTYEFTIVGGRNYKSLSHIILDTDGNEILTEAQASEVIADLITTGRNYFIDFSENENDRRYILEIAHKIQFQRFNKVQEEIIRLNDSSIQKQLDIVERVTSAKINRIKETINEVKYQPSRSRIIPALEGQIKKLNSEREQKILEIESKKIIDPQTRLISAGILKIP